MQTHSRLSAQTLVWAIACALTVGALVVLRLPSLTEPRWYGDEGIFAAVAQKMRAGRSLYSEAWDNKPPLIFVTYAATQAMFGNGVGVLHAVTTAFVVATHVVVIALAWALAGPRRAAVAGALFALALGSPIIEGNLAMTETFMILPTSLAMLAILGGHRAGHKAATPYEIAAGVLFGVAAAYKQVAVFDAMAACVFLAFTAPRPNVSIARLAAGFIVPQALLAAIFVATGAFGAYWYAVAGSLGLYAELAPQSDAFSRIAGYLPALLATGYLVRRQRLGGDVSAVHLPMLWLGFAVIGATSSTFAFPHYIEQVVPAAVLVIALPPMPKERDDLGRIALAVGGLLVAAALYGQFAPAYRERKQLYPATYYRTFASHQWGTMSDIDYALKFDGKALAVDDISAFIRDDDAGDTAFVWGELPWVYPAAGVTNPTRYYTSFLGELVPDAKPEIMRDLQAKPPVYVVVHGDSYAPFRELDAFVESGYALLRAEGDWQLYRLRTATGALTSVR